MAKGQGKSIKSEEFEKAFAYHYVRNGMNGIRSYQAIADKFGKKCAFNTMVKSASLMLKRNSVKTLVDQYVFEMQQEENERYHEEKRKIIDNMWNVYQKALEEQQEYDRNGKPLGENYKINSITNANKALENLAKATGLFVDKVETKNETTIKNVEVIEVEIE